MKWRWLPWLQPPEQTEAVEAKTEAIRKFEETQQQGQKVDALAQRLHTQIHKRNQLGKLFDEAFRGVK